MSAQDANDAASDVTYIDELNAFLKETEEPLYLHSITSELPRPTAEENFALEAYRAISDLQSSIARLHGAHDYCKNTAAIRSRLSASDNDPDILASRINAHASRLGVELRALSSLFFGNQLGI